MKNGTDLTTSTIVVLPKKTGSSNGTIEWNQVQNMTLEIQIHLSQTTLVTALKLMLELEAFTIASVMLIFSNNTINWGSSTKFD